MIVKAAIDTWVRKSTPSGNYGGLNYLTLRGSASSAESRSHMFFPRPFPLNATILTGTLRFTLNQAWAGTNTVTAYRITAGWSESLTNWSNQPAVTATNFAQVVVVNGVAGQVVEIDVSDMLQDVANSSAAFYGIRLSIDSASTYYLFHSSEAANASVRPELEVTWSEAPNPPTQLIPDGQVVSSGEPTLRWSFTDKVGNAVQASSQVQVATDADFASVEYDSGEVANDLSSFDLTKNLLTENISDIEVDTTGWAVHTNCSIARSTAQAQEGAASLSMTSTAGGDMGARTATGTSGVPITAGLTYTVSGYFRSAVSARDVFMRINWYDSGGSLVTTVDGDTVADTTTGWTRAHLTATAPPTAAFAMIAGRVVATGAGSEVHYLDSVMLEENDGASGWTRGYDGFADAATRYWRVKVWDQTGFESEWSEGASMTRDDHGSLTIDSPSGATVPETTPNVTWTFTGETQEAYRLALYRVATSGALTTLWSQKTNSTDTEFQVPSGLIKTGETYRLSVEVWDEEDRALDDHVIEWTDDFTYVRDGTPDAVETLTVDTVSGSPRLDLEWTRTDAPDYWCLTIDGVEVDDRISVSDTHVSGTTYAMSYWTATPRQELTVEVEAVVQSGASDPFEHSDDNPTVDVETNPTGIWLADPEDNTAVQIMGRDDVDLAIGESAETYAPIGALSPVRITDIVRGYAGSVSGVLLSASARDTFLTLKERLGELVLVVGDVSIPVRLEEAATAPTSAPGDVAYTVSFAFFQCGPPWPIEV